MDVLKFLSQKGRMILGELVDFEGELMDVFIKSPDFFQVGEQMTCIYAGYEFQTVVLKIYGNHVYLYVPLFHDKFPNSQRKIPRVNFKQPAAINDCVSDQIFHLPPELKVNLLDFNVKGFGFASLEPLNVNTQYFLYFDIENEPIKTKIILRNEVNFETGFRYGSEIQAITKQDFHKLRRLVLTTQLSNSIKLENSI